MESENYVYKKEVDWSTLMEGFTLPLDNLGYFPLKYGTIFCSEENLKLFYFFMNRKTYDAKIVNVNNSVEKERRTHIKSGIQEMEICLRHFNNIFLKP